jgi:hypothetical protein
MHRQSESPKSLNAENLYTVCKYCFKTSAISMNIFSLTPYIGADSYKNGYHQLINGLTAPVRDVGSHKIGIILDIQGTAIIF